MIDANAKFVLPITFSQTQRILVVLGKEPYREVADLINYIEQIANAAAKGMQSLNGVGKLTIPEETVNGSTESIEGR